MKEIKPNIASDSAKKQQVEEMFNGISSSYDKANRFISLGMDLRWKKKLINRLLATQPSRVLDLATGTADLPLMMCDRGLSAITGLDLSPGMLEVAKDRVKTEGRSDAITLVQGDSENLPFNDATFDAVSVSYGLRNYEDLEKGLHETFRVLKPNGHFFILETSVPHHFPVKQGYSLFTKVIMPLLGKLFSGDKNAYTYLSASASKFPCGDAMVQILENAGFSHVKVMPQFFGAATIYHCFRS